MLRTTEAVYAIVALFALTQGPIYRMWSASAAEVDISPTPTIAHAYFATFIAIQLPATALLVRRLDSTWFREISNRALALFLGWLGLTVLWSTFARQSFPEFVALVSTTAFGLYLARSFTPTQFWCIVLMAMSLGVGFSWLAVMRLWDGAVNFQENYWIGIYYNRNSLAPVTAVAIVATLGFCLAWMRTTNRRTAEKVLVGIVLAILVFASVTELWNTKSQTSPLALAAGVLAVAFWLVLRGLGNRVNTLRFLLRYSAPLVLIVGAISLFVALRLVGGFGGLSSEVTTLNSRRGLWSLSWSGFLERPLHGWGWMAAWRTVEFFTQGVWWGVWDSVWSHNGYHDILLGGGVPAAVLFSIYLWCGARTIDNASVEHAVPRLLLAVFVLTAATQESLFIGSHFAWALLAAVLVGAGRNVELSEQNYTGKSST